MLATNDPPTSFLETFLDEVKVEVTEDGVQYWAKLGLEMHVRASTNREMALIPCTYPRNLEPMPRVP